ncbi:MAG: hypothetical protein RRY33_07155 [Alistipes sp.]
MKKFVFVCVGLLLIGCGRQGSLPPISETDSMHTVTVKAPQPCNAIYHWKTAYNPNSSELEFMRNHDVKRLYLRFFDVALDSQWLSEELSVMPIATTTFPQIPSPDLEVVPTVYITLDALRNINQKEVEYADRIVTRILAMATRHKITNINEVQFDCDWTKSTQNSYFELCRIAGDSLHTKGIALSSTIRLHQLRDDCPPVDRGVLMLYNTGAIKSSQTENSILSYADVVSYLRKHNYQKPLDFAYPAFAWGVWFRENRFKAILRTTDFSNRSYYRPQSDGTYLVVKDHYIESHELLRGDKIRLERPCYDDILKVKQLAKRNLTKNTDYSVILYHLDSTSLIKFTSDEITHIYHR